jgi:F-type H+-transporting ATPase subunit epsilon
MADALQANRGNAAIRLTIVTPTGRADGKVGPVLDTWVDEVIAPGALGEFQVLPGHTHVLTQLVEGEVAHKGPSGTGSFAIFGGFAEIGPDRVSILAEGASEAGEIDMAKTIAEKEKYEKLLMEIGPMDPRYDETRKAIKELVALMTVAQRKK